MLHVEAGRRTTMSSGTSRDVDPKQRIHEDGAGFSLSDASLANYTDNFDAFVTQTWLSDDDAPWDRSNPWSHGAASIPPPHLLQDGILYPSFEAHCQEVGNTHHNAKAHNPAVKTNNNCTDDLVYQPPVQLINDGGGLGYGGAYHSQTPQTSRPLCYQPDGANTPKYPPHADLNLHSIGYSHCAYPVPEEPPEIQHTQWPLIPSKVIRDPTIFVNSFPDMNPGFMPASGLTLDWSPSSKESHPLPQSVSPSHTAPVLKRKQDSQPSIPKAPIELPKGLSEFVVVFENAPGALASIKRRKKLDAPVRKAAKDVRRAGACHQCRFRKRTCSTGTPCGTCVKIGDGLQEIKCQRESPFVGKLMHQYFEHSSTRRVVSFNISIPLDSFTDPEIVIVDGVGRLSHPIHLRARRKTLKSFSRDAQDTIKQTEDSQRGQTDQDPSTTVMILEDDKSLGMQLEQWALEYTSKFVHAAGPEFYSTTMAQILGTAYVQRRLPESGLVASMLRVASLAFVLRAGVKFTTTSTQPSPRFRTIQARIDTILYERLKIAERDLFQRLQGLIFRTAGCLNRDQVYPVALTMWQLMRILSIAASHLSNIVERFQSKAFGPANYQLHGLKLLVSTHMALFRSSNPLLLDFRDKFNQDLLGGDKELIKLAMLMRKVVLNFRQKGFPDLKGSIVWRKEYFEMFRRVYDGL